VIRPYFDALRAAADKVVEADRLTREKIVRVRGRETLYTSAFLTRLEDRLNGFDEAGIKWSVHVHEPDKQNKEEELTGADMLVVLDLDIDGITLRKGFLAQAKINTNPVFGQVRISGHDRLTAQCDAMLFHSPESFVFVYSEDATMIVPAIGVYALDARGISRLRRSTVHEFFYDFFTCWVGDRSISASSPAELQGLTAEMAAKRAAYVKGKATREIVRDLVPPAPPRRYR
jgi:hypothetical protein